MNIILASASPRRKLILRRLGYRVRVMLPGIDENLYRDRSPSKLAVRLASAKAGKVAKKVKNSVIIGADTVVLCGREFVGKPDNYKDSKRILKKLSGSKHKVITGYAVIDQLSGKIYRGYDQSVVHFRAIPDSEIEKLARKHTVSYTHLTLPTKRIV